MTPKEILIKAKARIADPKHWCKGLWAMDANHKGIRSTSPKACQWCSEGAINSLDARETYPAREVLERACRDEGFVTIVQANDACTHEQIMKIWDEAIARAS